MGVQERLALELFKTDLCPTNDVCFIIAPYATQKKRGGDSWLRLKRNCQSF